LLRFIEEKFQKTPTCGWFYSFLSRHSQDEKPVIVSRQELPRFQIPRRYLQGYIDLLKAYVPLIPSEVVFNVDETGLSD
jgi:hypothetical protein